ncbi:hypothetical protein PM082_013677 [Marasmius tenuissimus]|nr:hypothetical protein PM082_013677 [Marasmius tenuissimus]
MPTIHAYVSFIISQLTMQCDDALADCDLLLVRATPGRKRPLTSSNTRISTAFLPVSGQFSYSSATTSTVRSIVTQAYLLPFSTAAAIFMTSISTTTIINLHPAAPFTPLTQANTDRSTRRRRRILDGTSDTSLR